MSKPLLIAASLGILAATAEAQSLRSPSSYTRRISGSESGSSTTPRPQPTPTPSQAAQANPAAPAPVVVVPMDPEKAKALREETDKKTFEFQYRRALAGSAGSQYDVGIRFLTGSGVQKNETNAVKWLTASATNGYPLAIKKLEELKLAAKPAN